MVRPKPSSEPESLQSRPHAQAGHVPADSADSHSKHWQTVGPQEKPTQDDHAVEKVCLGHEVGAASPQRIQLKGKSTRVAKKRLESGPEGSNRDSPRCKGCQGRG